MTNLQKQILSMLEIIKKICQEHNIKWFLMYGTLLGAIRHRGFIPWDDDADIVMLRTEYDKFEKAFKKSLYSKDFTLRTLFNNIGKDGQPFARFCEKSSEQLLKLNTFYSESYGNMIDIFILDDYSSDLKKQEEYKDILADIIEIGHDRYCTSLFMDKKVNPKHIIYNKIKNRKKIVSKYLQKLIKCGEPDSEYVIQRYSIPHIYKRSFFDEQKFVEFEGVFLPVSYAYAEILNIQFGYQWDDIPLNRVDHSSNFILPTNKEKISVVENVHKNISINKNKLLHLAFKWLNLTSLLNLRKNWASGREIQAEHIKLLINSKEFSELERIGIFLNYQLSPYFIGRLIAQKSYNMYAYRNPYLIDIDDELLAKSLNLLNDSGLLNRSSRLIEVYKNKKNEPNNLDLKMAISRTESLCEIFNLFSYKRFIETIEKCIIYIKNYKLDPIVIKYYNMSLFFIDKERDLDTYINTEVDDINFLFYKSYNAIKNKRIKQGVYTLYNFIRKTNNSYLMYESFYLLECIESIESFSFISNKMRLMLFRALGVNSYEVSQLTTKQSCIRKSIVEKVINNAKSKLYNYNFYCTYNNLKDIFYLIDYMGVSTSRLAEFSNRKIASNKYTFINVQELATLKKALELLEPSAKDKLAILGFDKGHYCNYVKFGLKNSEFFDPRTYNTNDSTVGLKLFFLQKKLSNKLLNKVSTFLDLIILNNWEDCQVMNVPGFILLKLTSFFRVHKIFKSYYSYLMCKEKIIYFLRLKHRDIYYTFIAGKRVSFTKDELRDSDFEKLLREHHNAYDIDKGFISSFVDKKSISDLSTYAFGIKDNQLSALKTNIYCSIRYLKKLQPVKMLINYKVNLIWQEMEFEYYKYLYFVLYRDYIQQINKLIQKNDYNKLDAVLKPYIEKFLFYYKKGRILLCDRRLTMILVKYIKIRNLNINTFDVLNVASCYTFPQEDDLSPVNIEIFKERQLQGLYEQIGSLITVTYTYL